MLVIHQNSKPAQAVAAVGVYQASIILVPLILTGCGKVAERIADGITKERFIGYNPIQQELKIPEYARPTQEEIKVTQTIIECLEKQTQAIAHAPSEQDELGKVIGEQISLAAHNLKMTDGQTREAIEALIGQLKQHEEEDPKSADQIQWQPTQHGIGLPSYYKPNFIHDRVLISFYDRLAQQRKQTDIKVINGAITIAVLMYKALGAFVVKPLKNIEYTTTSDKEFQHKIDSNPLLKASYDYAQQHLFNQLITVFDQKKNFAVRAESLMLLNQAQMEGKFGRNCTKLAAQLNYLYCDKNGDLNFDKFNDPLVNEKAAPLFDEFLRFSANDHDEYVNFFTIASKSNLPGMKNIVAQAKHGKVFSVGQGTLSKWAENIIGSRKSYIDPRDVNARKLNKDFLTFVGHLRAGEFDPQADMNFNFWKAWGLRNKYVQSIQNGSNALNSQLNDKIRSLAVAMNNLFRDHFHKNREKYGLWDNFDKPIYIDPFDKKAHQYKPIFDTIIKDYKITFNDLLYGNHFYRLSPQFLNDFYNDTSKRESFNNLIEHLRKECANKQYGKSKILNNLLKPFFSTPNNPKDIGGIIMPDGTIKEPKVELLPPRINPDNIFLPGPDLIYPEPELPEGCLPEENSGIIKEPSICPPEEPMPLPKPCNHANGANRIPSITGGDEVASGNNGPGMNPENTVAVPENASKPEPKENTGKQEDEDTGKVAQTEEDNKLPIFEIPDITIDRNGVFATEELIRELNELLILRGFDGEQMLLDNAHMAGGSIKDGKVSGLHLESVIKPLIEKGIIEIDGTDFSKIYEIPEGYNFIKWRIKGTDSKFKPSSVFKDMPLEELAKIIQEAWENVKLKKDDIIKLTNNFKQPLDYITGTAINGIEIEFRQVDFSRSFICSIYPVFDEKINKKNWEIK